MQQPEIISEQKPESEVLNSRLDDIHKMLEKLTQQESKLEESTTENKNRFLNNVQRLGINVKDFLKFWIRTSDKIVSKKIIVAIVVPLAPAIALYCRYFNPTIFESLIEKFSRATTSGVIKTGEVVAEGVVNGALDNKKTVLKLAGIYFVFRMAEKLSEKVWAEFADQLGPKIVSKTGVALVGLSKFVVSILPLIKQRFIVS